MLGDSFEVDAGALLIRVKIQPVGAEDDSGVELRSEAWDRLDCASWRLLGQIRVVWLSRGNRWERGRRPWGLTKWWN